MNSLECEEQAAEKNYHEDIIKRHENNYAVLKEHGVSFWTFVRHSKTAKVQIGWLLICLLIFIIMGIIKFFEAMSNETSQYKPEKKVSSIDYGDANNALEYEMPWFYILFRIRAPASYNGSESYWTDEMTNSTLSTMMETLDFLNMRTYITYNYNWDQTWATSSWEEASFILLGTFFDINYDKDEIAACFKIKATNPDPTKGPFAWSFLILKNHMTLAATLDVYAVRLTVSRGDPPEDYLKHRALEIDKWDDGFGIALSYEENVLQTVNPESTNYDFSISTRATMTVWNGTLGVMIFPNLVVPVWTEYVEFGYTDWIGMMGGYFSLVSVAFVFGSNHILKWFVEDSMNGILPMVSFSYYNRQKILRLTSQLENDVENEVSSKGFANVRKYVKKGKTASIAL